MITARQIRAARGLLGWDAVELARKTGLTKETISRIEIGQVRPREQTMLKILRVFDESGIEFTEDEGLKIRKSQVRIFSGKEEYKHFLDHIYSVMKDGGRICQFNLSDGKNLPHADDYAKTHLDRMAQIENLDARVLTYKGDYAFPSSYCQYRWLPEENKALTPYYVYNDFLEMPIYRTDRNVEIISIRSKQLAERYIEQFDLLWETSLIPDKKVKE